MDGWVDLPVGWLVLCVCDWACENHVLYVLYMGIEIRCCAVLCCTRRALVRQLALLCAD
jgi:hypothetical protein